MAKKFNLRKDQRNRKYVKKKRKTNVSTMAINVRWRKNIHYSLPGGNTAKCVINLKNAYVDQSLNST